MVESKTWTLSENTDRRRALIRNPVLVWPDLHLYALYAAILKDPLPPPANPSSSTAGPPCGAAGSDDKTREPPSQEARISSEAPHTDISTSQDTSGTHERKWDVSLSAAARHLEESVFLYRVGCLLLLPWLLYSAPGRQGAHREGLGQGPSGASHLGSLRAQGTPGESAPSERHHHSQSSGGSSAAWFSSACLSQGSAGHRGAQQKNVTAEMAERARGESGENECHEAEEDTSAVAASQTGQHAILPVAALVSIGKAKGTTLSEAAKITTAGPIYP